MKNNWNELTIGSCFFNTPKLVLPFLQSIAKFHKKYKPIKLCIMDNSVTDECNKLFISNGITPFINKAMSHHEAVNVMFDNVKTKYLLLLDSDIVLKNDITPIFKQFIESGAAIGGHIQGSRGGFDLYDRVVPWFTFIDMDVVRKENIKFFIREKHEFHTEWNEPNRIALRPEGKHYDVGAEFFESVHIEHGYPVWEMSEQKAYNYYLHFEGMSWRPIDKNPHYVNMANQVVKQYEGYYKSQGLSSIQIKNFYI
jgi:glycosyltransferase involved in cell wall biosynthesis